MTNQIERNPQTLAKAAQEVLKTYCIQSDAAYVAEIHLELELIEQGFMKPDESIVAFDRWSDPRFLSVVFDRDLISHIVINADTGEVTYDQSED